MKTKFLVCSFHKEFFMLYSHNFPFVFSFFFFLAICLVSVDFLIYSCHSLKVEKSVSESKKYFLAGTLVSWSSCKWKSHRGLTISSPSSTSWLWVMPVGLTGIGYRDELAHHVLKTVGYRVGFKPQTTLVNPTRLPPLNISPQEITTIPSASLFNQASKACAKNISRNHSLSLFYIPPQIFLSF